MLYPTGGKKKTKERLGKEGALHGHINIFYTLWWASGKTTKILLYLG